MQLEEIINLDKKYFMNTFGNRTPVCFSHGKGINLWDINGKKYYDFLAGIAVNALGHSHPKLVNAIKQQAEKLIHCSNLYYIESQAKLAEKLVSISCADKVFFANSGAEANEGAIKLARIYFKKKGMPEKYEIITLEKSFHGRTLATIAATGQDKYQKPYCPLTPKFLKVPINDLEALEKAINSSTCAVMIEPIQGESGVNLTSVEYMKGVRKLCDEKGILLIFDEVQCGLGRTGKLFAYEHFGVEPDIFTLAKALGGGFPIGALCAKEHVASAFEPGDHGSTFGGNPLACTAALAALDVIIEEGLVENSAKMGTYFMSKLSELAEKYSIIQEVRGKGLMIGVQLSIDAAVEIKNKCFEKGYLIGSIGNNILRMLPPLIVTEQDIDGMIDTLDSVFQEYQI
ncbi:acetylornithine aminotransferase [Acetivibrio thermocellus AD2]|jgi:acetylornithine/N-succinyldiaminopimelate aminotransferase|uniref:Acetylornithine aminotransferase n=1 Tax=Acetivibrio thermocellus AD2 TaxID=1138384 RepID=A0AB36TIZ1_ACETH|nr:acetylornithine transaminase [Acetivibrio thermocellus]ADU75562.1 acetylornithine and succinylornithine aminotransferase [Acetivibrio thermocellus DSM 1313]ALX09553.1 Acetylornithine/succinyldiaminopimelate aminotransferase [Acetivibrio thermocellus AD2]ANV77325.1 Acetylornithine/succinyldiaminopimelate aminotransferase [Acetivibrio thermocellus DSM 2360]EIC04491.1 acetylornithine and succinylornithine aminotransferase [Acetivibrio thermocellus YS]PFH03834.1 acetylornithine aminotransferase